MQLPDHIKAKRDDGGGLSLNILLFVSMSNREKGHTKSLHTNV